jgi:hypothetical protein
MRRIVATLCWLASFFPAILTQPEASRFAKLDAHLLAFIVNAAPANGAISPGCQIQGAKPFDLGFG